MGNGYLIQIEYAQRINYGLIHAGLDHMVRSINVPEGLRARLRVAGFSEKVTLAPGTSCNFSPTLDPHMLARLSAPAKTQIVIEIEGHHDEPHPVEIAPLCAWSYRRQHAKATAAFVLENDPVIADLVRQADIAPEPAGNRFPVEVAAERLYRELVPFFGPCYLFERSLFEPNEQGVRFPLQMKYDLGGTCLDLCLAYAAALLRSGYDPLLLFLNNRNQQHCMVGVWLSQSPGVEAPTAGALERAREHEGLWVPIEATWAFQGGTYEEARRKAEEQLGLSPLSWAVDISAARKTGLASLPSRPCTTTFHHWEARSLDERTKTLATAAAATLNGLIVEVIDSGHPADRGKQWNLTGFKAAIGRGYRHEIGLFDATISDPHAVIFADGVDLRVQDLFSRNGVCVGDEHLAPGGASPVRVGEVFQLGQVKLRLIQKNR